MKKERRDQMLSTMDPDQRLEFSRILREVRAQAKVAAGHAGSSDSASKSSLSQYPVEIRARLDAVMQRDQMGPKEGETPPDFCLKRAGSEERVRLSNFKGKSSVALVFGSYT